MLRNYLPFYEISGELHGLLFHTDLMKDSKLSQYDSDVPRYEQLLATIQKACEEHGLSHTAEMAARAAQRKPKTNGDVHHELTSLNDSLTRELAQEAIFRIPAARMDYYDRGDLFGPEVTAAFSSCARDIRKAGSCYALGQEDACVHHLMLVLERGLNALAAKVGVSYHRTNWQEIINNITSQVKTMPRGTQKDFYIEVNAQFGFLKDAYRNHAEHARDDPYDMAKASSIFDHVRTFMQDLAKGGLTE